jgi:hypothetical protein
MPVKRFKRIKTVRRLAKDVAGNTYLLYDNAVSRVLQGTTTGKFYCYASLWRIERNKLQLTEDWTDTYIP